MSSEDLLSQISASDKTDVVQKRRQSAFMALVVRFMRIMLQFDELRHKNQRWFDLAAVIWGLLLTVLYCGAIVAMMVLIYSYTRFPNFVRDYFEQNNIAAKELKIDNYDFSKIEVSNIVDPDGTYTIKNVTIYSSFSEFLRRRVKSVVVDGVNVKIKETKEGLDFGNLPQILTRLNQGDNAEKIHINTLSVMNAQIEFEGQKLKLPISFSLTGAYDSNTKLTLPFSVKQEDIKLVGALSVAGSRKEMEWTLDVTSGTLSLPDSYPENITGKLIFKTRQMNLSGVSGNVRLSYGKNVKELQVNLTKNEEEYTGDVSFDIVNQNATEGSQVKTTVGFTFAGVKIPSLSQLETDKPIQLKLQSFIRENVSMSDLAVELKGRLKCDGFSCTYHLKEASPATIQSFKIKNDLIAFENTEPVRFTLAPTKRVSEPLIAYKGNRLHGAGIIQNLSCSGFSNRKENTIQLTASYSDIIGSYDEWKHEKVLEFRGSGISYETPEQKVEEASYTSMNLFDEKETVRMRAQKVQLKKNPLILKPFRFVSEQSGNDAKAVLDFMDGKIKVALNGKMILKNGEFDGEIFMHPVNLGELQVPLSEISAFFPESIKNVSGTMGVFGNLNWKNTKQISGPLFVAFKDAGFDAANLKVKGLNTVLLFQSLSPFVTAAPQNVFAAEVSGPFRFQNVMAQIKLESQLMRIASMEGQIGGLNLRMDPIMLPYKTENITMYLRNNSFDFAQVNGWLMNDALSLSGHGAVTIPLRFDRGFFAVRNGEFKMSNGTIGYKGTNEAVRQRIFQGVPQIHVQSGSGTFSSMGTGDIYSLFLSLDGRWADGNKFRVKETVSGVLGDWLKPAPTMPVPGVIAAKQAVVIK